MLLFVLPSPSIFISSYFNFLYSSSISSTPPSSTPLILQSSSHFLLLNQIIRSNSPLTFPPLAFLSYIVHSSSSSFSYSFPSSSHSFSCSFPSSSSSLSSKLSYRGRKGCEVSVISFTMLTHSLASERPYLTSRRLKHGRYIIAALSLLLEHGSVN